MKRLSRSEYAQFYSSFYSDATPSVYNSSPGFFYGVVDALGLKDVVLCDDRRDREVVIVGRMQRQGVRARLGYIRVPLPRPMSLVVVYGGVLSRGGGVDGDAITRLVFETHPEVGAIHFTKLPVDDASPIRITGAEWTIVGPRTSHHALDISGGFDSFMSTMSSKRRQKLRWERKKLEEAIDGFRIVTQRGLHELDAAIMDMETIGRDTYHSGIGSAVVRSSVWVAQLRSFADQGNLRAHIMYNGSRPVAYCLCVSHGLVVHVLAMAFLPEFGQFSPGKHLLLHAIEAACKDGALSVDYGFGDAQYKTQFGSRVWYEHDVSVYRKGVGRAPGFLVSAVASKLANQIRRSAGEHVAGGVKKRWRSHLRSNR